MNAGSSVQPVGLDHLGVRRRVETVAECRDLAVAHEHVEPRVDALAGIEDARAAHEHVGGAAPGAWRQAALARVRSRRAPPVRPSRS